MPHTVNRRQVLALGTAIAASAALGSPLRAQNRIILNAVTAQEPGVLAAGISTIDGSQSITGGKVLQSLVRYNEDNELEGELAESWTMSDDGKVYTLKLRPGVLWHDGKPLTADDVVFSLDKILRETHSRTASVIARITKFEAPDAGTVVLTLEAPYLPFLTAINSVNAPILPKHLYEGTDFRQNPVNNAPVGTGPFRFNEWKRGEYVHLVRFDDYWGEGEPHVDEIYFQFIPDSAQRAIAMETGRIDVALRQVISPTDVKRLVAAGQAKLIDGSTYDGLGAASMLLINQRKKPFDDVRVRRALLHALDRQLIVDNAFLGEGIVQVGPIASSTRYFDRAANTFYEYDPEKAKALLAEAGVSNLAFEITVASANAERQRMMEIIAQQYSEVGIAANIVFVDVPTLQKRGGEWDFDLQFSTVGQFQDPSIGITRNYLTSRINHSYGNNISGYSNPRVDELFAKADAALSEAEAQPLYSEIQKLVTEDAPYVWLFEVQDNLLVRPNIDGMHQGPMSAYYSWAEVTKS